jgi:putative acetyltransferase
MSIQIRKETNNDIDSIDQLNREAFEGESEPKLIKLLRERDELVVSLVALVDDDVVGHVCASLVTVDGLDCSVAGIGPLSVDASHRCKGIGGLLMEEVLVHLRNIGFVGAVLLGDPKYYPRFGFTSGSEFGLQNEYGAGDAFMAMELQPEALNKISGMVKYASAFSECDA